MDRVEKMINDAWTTCKMSSVDHGVVFVHAVFYLYAFCIHFSKYTARMKTKSKATLPQI